MVTKFQTNSPGVGEPEAGSTLIGHKTNIADAPIYS